MMSGVGHGTENPGVQRDLDRAGSTGRSIFIFCFLANPQYIVSHRSRLSARPLARQYYSDTSMRLEFLDALIDDELRTLCVPLEHCVSVKTGKVDSGVLAELENRGLDQAPVFSS